MSVQLSLDFSKETLSKAVLEMLATNLGDEVEGGALKAGLKESLAMIQKGNKVPYGPANQLLLGILRSMSLTDELDGDETFQGSPQVNDNTIHGSTSGASTSEEATEEDSENTVVQVKTPKYGKKDGKKENASEPNSKVNRTKSETCRFYVNGKCKYKSDCRFAHPKICPKFRQDGDCEVRGCGGDCGLLHPNVCHNSLKDKTCPYTECRFFHLKGTKTVERGNRPYQSSDPNRGSKQGGNQNNGQNNQQRGSNHTAAKNGRTGLSQKAKKKDTGHRNQNQNGQNQTPNPVQNQKPKTKKETVTREEKNRLGQTLEAIMRRLEAMEARPAFQQAQPLLSPATPHYAWTQGPWTQTQTQSQK